VIVPLQVTFRRATYLTGLVMLALTASGQSSGQTIGSPSVLGLLDRYQKGDYGAAVQLAGATDPAQVRSSYIATAEAWIARDPTDLPNRRLVATAFALEVAHARLAYDSPTLVVLLDWARKEWRKGPPSPAERAWTRAAMALVGRGGKLITATANSLWGSTFVEDAGKRFPDDPWVRLARLAWRPSTEARLSLERLTEHPDIGPDVLVELAFHLLSQGDSQAAGRFADQAATRAAEPWTRYLAHFIVALCRESQGRSQEAVQEYSAALKAVPHAQSASIRLALMLLKDNQANAAFDLLNRSLTERPDGDDPWRLFAYRGYVRWPALIADVRKAIR
jgi:tetratricopeptide (TPR) repeat protein